MVVEFECESCDNNRSDKNKYDDNKYDHNKSDATYKVRTREDDTEEQSKLPLHHRLQATQVIIFLKISFAGVISCMPLMLDPLITVASNILFLIQYS